MSTQYEFWNKVWQEQENPRFHQSSFNSMMVDYFHRTDLKDKTVLIPLAGKTKDILYFLEKGAIVTAIEFCEKAIISFFEENNLSYKKEGQTYTAFNLKFYSMDFFEFQSEKAFDVFYDRASQVVFSADSRPAYYHQVSKCIDSNTQLLLFSVEHSGPENHGPPFKISQQEIKSSYQKMGIPLHFFSQRSDQAGEVLQKLGVDTITTFSLTNKL